MKTKPKIILASLIASLAVLILPVLMAIFAIILNYYGHLVADPTDDAPVRAAGVILVVLVPLAYPILFLIMCALGYGLNYKNQLTLKNLYIFCALASIPLAIRFGWASPYGIKDQIIGLMVFFPLTIICFFLGAYCWWKIAMWGYKQKEIQA